MKLLILGHSYVRDLSKLGVSYITHERNVIDVKYVAYPGASYDLFLRDPSKLTAALSYNPDIVVVVLAGNAMQFIGTSLIMSCSTSANLFINFCVRNT